MEVYIHSRILTLSTPLSLAVTQWASAIQHGSLPTALQQQLGAEAARLHGSSACFPRAQLSPQLCPSAHPQPRGSVCSPSGTHSETRNPAEIQMPEGEAKSEKSFQDCEA